MLGRQEGNPHTVALPASLMDRNGINKSGSISGIDDIVGMYQSNLETPEMDQNI
jgi:hypothetical protein